MAYRIVPLKKAPDLQLEDTFGVRTGNNRDEAVSRLEKVITQHIVKAPSSDAVIYVYPASSNKFYEAVLTTNLKYVPNKPEVIVRDNRRRERF